MPGSYLAAGTRAALQAVYEPLAAFAGFHTGSPGSTGANESTIARVPLTWAGNSTTVSLVVPSGVTVMFVGFWTASSGGTYVDGTPLPSIYAGPTSVNLTLGPLGVVSAN